MQRRNFLTALGLGAVSAPAAARAIKKLESAEQAPTIKDVENLVRQLEKHGEISRTAANAVVRDLQGGAKVVGLLGEPSATERVRPATKADTREGWAMPPGWGRDVLPEGFLREYERVLQSLYGPDIRPSYGHWDAGMHLSVTCHESWRTFAPLWQRSDRTTNCGRCLDFTDYPPSGIYDDVSSAKMRMIPVPAVTVKSPWYREHATDQVATQLAKRVKGSTYGVPGQRVVVSAVPRIWRSFRDEAVAAEVMVYNAWRTH